MVARGWIHIFTKGGTSNAVEEEIKDEKMEVRYLGELRSITKRRRISLRMRFICMKITKLNGRRRSKS
mgnify:CR=1 FL=1